MTLPWFSLASHCPLINWHPPGSQPSCSFNHRGSWNNPTVLLLLTVRNLSHTVPLSNWWCPSFLGGGEEGPAGKEQLLPSWARENQEGDRWTKWKSSQKFLELLVGKNFHWGMTEYLIKAYRWLREFHLPRCSAQVQQGFPHFLQLIKSAVVQRTWPQPMYSGLRLQGTVPFNFRNIPTGMHYLVKRRRNSV